MPPGANHGQFNQRALSVGPYDGRDDVKRLVLVPTAEAERFIVAADHLRLVKDGAKVALGTPP